MIRGSYDMNKTLLTLLLALTPAALYIVFALFNPLPPFTTQYVMAINSFTKTIITQFQGFFGNFTALGGSLIGTVAGGAITNYVRGRMQQTAETQAKEVIGEKDQQITSLYKVLGANEEKIIALEKEGDKVSKLETKVSNQKLTISQQEKLIDRLQQDDAHLKKQDKDEITTNILNAIRKP